VQTPNGPSTIACWVFGGKCFSGKTGSSCAMGPCAAGETYMCDGDNVTACMHGLRVKTPCGAGRTCGEEAGTHMIGCIGKGDVCTGPERCEGSIAVACRGDAGGDAHESRFDCATVGLECGLQTDSGVSRAICAPTTLGACDWATADTRCDGANVSACVAGAWVAKSCGDLGLAGSCTPAGGSATCGPP
jgi:hypothetical protein